MNGVSFAGRCWSVLLSRRQRNILLHLCRPFRFRRFRSWVLLPPTVRYRTITSHTTCLSPSSSLYAFLSSFFTVKSHICLHSNVNIDVIASDPHCARRSLDYTRRWRIPRICIYAASKHAVKYSFNQDLLSFSFFLPICILFLSSVTIFPFLICTTPFS